MIFIVKKLLLELIFLANEKRDFRSEGNWDTFSIKEFFHGICSPTPTIISISIRYCYIGCSNLIERVFLVNELIKRSKNCYLSPFLANIFSDLENLTKKLWITLVKWNKQTFEFLQADDTLQIQLDNFNDVMASRMVLYSHQKSPFFYLGKRLQREVFILIRCGSKILFGEVN